MPKRYTFYGAQALSELADTVYNEVKMANSIFPGNQHEVQIRRDHLIQANATLQALIGQLGIMYDLLYDVCSAFASWRSHMARGCSFHALKRMDDFFKKVFGFHPNDKIKWRGAICT